jgi:hypothetical protein
VLFPQAGLLEVIGRLSLLAVTFLVVTSCGRDAVRPGSEPTAPLTPADVAGNYMATSIVVLREAGYEELAGQPGTRITLGLNLDGSVHGQLKIPTDPALRVKRSLTGSWQFHISGFVTLDIRPLTFLSEMSFQVYPPGLVGEWHRPDVSLSIKLAKID